LGFDDGEVFREGMKGVDEETAGSFLDFHETDGDRGPACRGGKLVSHERLVAIVEEFLMKMVKDFRLELFVLEAEVIFEAGFEADRFLAVPPEFLSVEFFPEREGGLPGEDDFAEEMVGPPEGDGVTCVADLEFRGIGFLADLRGGFGVQQFGMNRSSEDLECELGHIGSDIADIHYAEALNFIR